MQKQWSSVSGGVARTSKVLFAAESAHLEVEALLSSSATHHRGGIVSRPNLNMSLGHVIHHKRETNVPISKRWEETFLLLQRQCIGYCPFPARQYQIFF